MNKNNTQNNSIEKRKIKITNKLNKNSLSNQSTENKKVNSSIIPGDIHLVNLGSFNGHVIGGIRPCLILQVDRQTVALIPITSQANPDLSAEFPLKAGIGGLDRDSYLKLTQPQTVPKVRISKRLGSIPRVLLSKIIRASALFSLL